MLWTLLAAGAIALLVPVCQPQQVGPGPVAILALLAVVSAVLPFDGLLAFAGFAPVSATLFALAGGNGVTRFDEALLLACVAGIAGRRAVQPRPLQVSSHVRWCALMLVAAAIASTVVVATIILATQPGLTAAEIVGDRMVNYFNTLGPMPAALLFIEGLVVFLLTTDLCAGNPERRVQALRMMAAGAAGAAALNVTRILTVSLAREDPWSVFVVYFTQLRVRVQYGDVNGAGSYFAMMLLIAAGLASRSRAFAIVSGLLIAAGLWVSGSRVALAAAFLAAAGWALASQRLGVVGRRTIAAGGALLILVAAGVWLWHPRASVGEIKRAFGIRMELAEVAVELTATEPVFGVGLGRFTSLAGDYADEPLVAIQMNHENAHNNFLQVLAELGIIGAALFIATIALGYRELMRANSAFGPTAGLLAGLTVYLLTCLGSHPLLVNGAAYPFWIALGLAAAPMRVVSPMERRWRLTGILGLVLLAATLPLRISAAVRNADLEGASAGLSLWQREPDGSRFRYASGQSTFYITSSVRAVRIPLRADESVARLVDLRILLDGTEVDRIRIDAGEGWRAVRLLLGTSRNQNRFARIDLEVYAPGASTPIDVKATDTSGALVVGRPELEP